MHRLFAACRCLSNYEPVVDDSGQDNILQCGKDWLCKQPADPMYERANTVDVCFNKLLQMLTQCTIMTDNTYDSLMGRCFKPDCIIAKASCMLCALSKAVRPPGFISGSVQHQPGATHWQWHTQLAQSHHCFMQHITSMV